MTDHARGDVRFEEYHRWKYADVVRPQVPNNPDAPVQNPVGIRAGDTVDVLLAPSGGYLGVTYIGTAPSSMLVFRLDDGRCKGHTPDEIVLTRRVS